MPTWISNSVKPVNAVAKEFTKKYLLDDDDGGFCFDKLVPIPEILKKITHCKVVSPDEFQAFKDEYHNKTTYRVTSSWVNEEEQEDLPERWVKKDQKQPEHWVVHCEYEQEGLLYATSDLATDEEYFSHFRGVCTAEFLARIQNMYGCDDTSDFCEKYWGTWKVQFDIGDDFTDYDDNGDIIACHLDTAGDAPWAFMAILTAKCPEGLWYWSCASESGRGFEFLFIELHNGDVVITDHLLDDDYEGAGYDLTVEDLYWNDHGDIPDYDDDETNDTELVPGKVFTVHPNYKVNRGLSYRCPSYWPNRVDNCVKPANNAAKEFIKQHVIEHHPYDDDDKDRFCFDKLLPAPDILLDVCDIVSPKELQAFKAEHKDSVHCEYEQEGLLYVDEESGDCHAVCTAECSARLKDMYGADNWADFCVQNWGDFSHDFFVHHIDDHDEEGEPVYNFRTEFAVPWGFMSALAKECPEGLWEWRCDAANGFESLVLQLRNGEVVITEHLLDEKKLESMREFNGKVETSDDLHWNDRGEVLALGKNDTKLVLGKVFSVKPNYVVPTKRANLA